PFCRAIGSKGMAENMPAAKFLPLAAGHSAFEMVVCLIVGQRDVFKPLLFAAKHPELLAKQKLTARVNCKPLLEHAGKKRRKREPPSGAFAANTLLLLDYHRAGFQVEITDPDSEDLATPGTGVRGKTQHREEKGMSSCPLGERQELLN